jgi:hypothetical protein
MKKQGRVLFASLEEGMPELVFVIGALCLMEIIHIELSDEGGEVIVLKEAWQNCLRKLIKLLHNEALPVCGPRHNGIVLLVLENNINDSHFTPKKKWINLHSQFRRSL